MKGKKFLTQIASHPRNKLADNASSNVSFEAVKARQCPEKTTELASATEKDSDEESSEKKKRAVSLSRGEVCQVLPAIFFVRKTTRL